ncbi:MAG: copper homeostasis protein CutC [Bacteroidota bacterium]
MLVEVCANSLQSALNAQEAGADRIELCSELGVGGVTPSYGLIQLVKKKLSIPVHVLIRPRSSHFMYSETEIQVMLANIDFCKEVGVDGIVTGVLDVDHSVDWEQMKKLVKRIKPLHFTFHRAFDWVDDPEESLRQLDELEIDTILTSGQCENALEGLENLQKWQSSSSIAIMAGGGIHPGNSMEFKDAGLKAIHLSGTTFVNSVPINEKIPMISQKHLSEHHVAVTNSDVIRQTIQRIK